MLVRDTRSLSLCWWGRRSLGKVGLHRRRRLMASLKRAWKNLPMCDESEFVLFSLCMYTTLENHRWISENVGLDKQVFDGMLRLFDETSGQAPFQDAASNNRRKRLAVPTYVSIFCYIPQLWIIWPLWDESTFPIVTCVVVWNFARSR